MACIGEDKLTKDLIRKTGVFSANLVTEELLPLADYYGNTSGYSADKMKRLPTVERGTGSECAHHCKRVRSPLSWRCGEKFIWPQEATCFSAASAM